MRRRHLLAVSVLLLSVALVAWPSGAGGRSKFSGTGANAAWYLGDEENTAVYVGAFDGSVQSPPGRAQKSKDLFVDIYQAFCDSETGEFVQREYFTYEPAANSAITVSRKLDHASVAGTVDLFGTEFRAAGCDEPKWDEGIYNDLGEFEVTISATWSGVGNAVKSTSSYHFNSGPDCKFSSHSSSKYRESTADGTITGDLPLGTLGGSDYAEMFSTRDMSIEIGSGCFID